jgi:hypothetical protein
MNKDKLSPYLKINVKYVHLLVLKCTLEYYYFKVESEVPDSSR